MKLTCVFLLSTLFLMGEWSGCLIQSLAQGAGSTLLNQQTEHTKQYTPPRRGLPGRREGAATR